MQKVLPSTEPPTEERWAALGSVLLATMYLWLLVWLLAAVVVPTVGLGWNPVVITSGSMEPLIRPGDIVVTGDAPADPVGPGTVITFEDPSREGALTTHRVVSVLPDGRYRTRGDANFSADSTPVPPQAVVGVGRLLVPMIGLPLLWLSGGLLLFVIWLGVTLAAVAVAAQSGEVAQDVPQSPPTSPRRSREPRRSPREHRRLGLAVAIRRLRPRSLQRRLVAAVVFRVGPWLRRVAPAARPVAGRVRSWLPLTVVTGIATATARTPLTITIAAVIAGVVAVLDPRGPELRIGRWHRTGVHVANVVVAALPTAALGRGMLAIVGVGLMTTASVGRSVAAFSAASSNTDSSFAASDSFPSDPPPPTGTTFWLQTSPVGQNTSTQLTLPFATSAPTETVLYNYSTDMDDAAGRLVKRKGSGPFETDKKLVQRWSQTLGSDLTISGAQLRIFTGLRNFVPAKGARFHFSLGDCAAGGTGCAVIAAKDLSRADWQGGNPSWVEDTVDFGPLSVTVAAGRELWVAVTVDNASGDDAWLAYGTVGQPSRLVLTSPPPGTCAGPGSTTVIATGDTYVLQSQPNANFSTTKELLVQSKSAENARTLLTFALPTLPAGCSVTSATLQMTTVTSKQGRTYQVVRADSAFDLATVAWATQPAATGPAGTGPSTVNGPTPLDATAPVRELYQLGNTGLVVRDAAESDSETLTNKYSSTEESGKPRPQLTVVWG